MSYAFPWFVLFLPLFAAVGIVLFTLKNRNVSATISIAAIVGGFFLTRMDPRAKRGQLALDGCGRSAH
jgi:hypothetical protein